MSEENDIEIEQKPSKETEGRNVEEQRPETQLIGKSGGEIDDIEEDGWDSLVYESKKGV